MAPPLQYVPIWNQSNQDLHGFHTTYHACFSSVQWSGPKGFFSNEVNLVMIYTGAFRWLGDRIIGGHTRIKRSQGYHRHRCMDVSITRQRYPWLPAFLRLVLNNQRLIPNNQHILSSMQLQLVETHWIWYQPKLCPAGSQSGYSQATTRTHRCQARSKQASFLFLLRNPFSSCRVFSTARMRRV